MSKFRSFLGGSYRIFVKPVLFSQDPEKVHDKFIRIGAFLGRHSFTKWLIRYAFYFEDKSLEQDVCGIYFKNPVGLSAGFDKDAQLGDILPDIGFGFMQIGSLTFKPYAGNPVPRLYRLKKSFGLVVNYGLKNLGVHKLVLKIKKIRSVDFPLGISVAKTNSMETVEPSAAIDDYYGSFKCLEKENVGDFYTINISCPNAFGGEPFSDPHRLDKLLSQLSVLNIKKPVFLKMPVDLEWGKFNAILELVISYGLSGVVIGNLTKNRNSKLIHDEIPEGVVGGISGRPLFHLTNDLIEKTYKLYGDKLVIIGVGGIFSAKDAYQKIKKGASLVQLITGMIYEGPQLIGGINEDLVELLKRDGYANISEAVGKN